MNQNLVDKAVQVLESNWRDGYTIPCGHLYPFQWNWDAGFIAIGWAHVDIKKAKQEINSLLKGQWQNGFIPQIVFHTPSDTYYPGPSVHGAYTSPHYPRDIETSGITQPPVLGVTLERIAQMDFDADFLEKAVDGVFQFHRYLYEYRDPQGEGLVYICHNWEAGTDNTPVWDHIWETLDTPDIELARKDNTHVDASNRPSKREYQHYIHLLQLFKEWKYNDHLIAEKSPFLVQDPLFNSLLVASNNSLIRLGEKLGKKRMVAQLQAWNALTLAHFHQKLYDEEKKAYVYYDLRNDAVLSEVSSSSFAPLFAKIPSEKTAKEMIRHHLDGGQFSGKHHEYYLCASFDPTHENFDPKRYWRGPVWVNLNWILYHGLKAYGYTSLAARLKADTLHLIETYGFYEYFDPRKAAYTTLQKGYGGEDFSWTAALAIDLLSEH